MTQRAITEAEWKARYVARFLKGPWDEGDITNDEAMQIIARDSANEAWADDRDADPEEAAESELDAWSEP